MFHHIPPHQDVLKQVWGNAQTLSCIYGYKGKAKGVSFVDFMLAGRMMLHKNIFLLSGNKKDFPSCIFDSEGTACFEDQKNMEPRTFWLLSFSQKKFEKCYSDLNKMETKNTKKLEGSLKKLSEEINPEELLNDIDI